MLRRIFITKRKKVAGGWRRPHEDELRNLYPSPNVISVIKTRRMRWAGHVGHVKEMRNTYKILVGKHKGKDYSKDLGRDRNITANWISGKEGGKVWTGFIWIRTVTIGGPL
jgi:hypothetical protein